MRSVPPSALLYVRVPAGLHTKTGMWRRFGLLDSTLVDLLKEHADNLLAAGLAGNNTSHGGENNLYKIRLMVDLDPNNTYGMEDLLRGVTFEEAYDAVSYQLGNPPDEDEIPGRGRIDPARTAEELLKAGRRIRAVAEAGGRFVFGTGHPGALLLYYIELAAWVEELGGQVLSAETGGLYGPRDRPLDWAGPVGVLGNRASLFHTHSPDPMRDILDAAGAVDLVVADHGFAGAAVAAGVPTVAIMDTNDPAFAVAASRGADLTVVPMDDNRPLNSYGAALEVVKSES